MTKTEKTTCARLVVGGLCNNYDEEVKLTTTYRLNS